MYFHIIWEVKPQEYEISQRHDKNAQLIEATGAEVHPDVMS